jgi:pimeloyl-ACP methyl ester carboxylesterase
MVPGKIVVDGRRLRFAVSDNVDAHGPGGRTDPPVWAVNIHGFFAGGGMYWRESSLLAQKMGWRVLNPSLPGFAGSDPLPWEQVNLRVLTEQVVRILDHLGVGPVILLGHSMGGAVAVQFADLYPDRSIGIIYRDGAATPEWMHRHGVLVSMLSPILPDMAGVIDLVMAAMFDTPDLLIGRRLTSTLRGLWPDARRNIRSMGRTLPIGTMLMSIDLRDEVKRVAEAGIPILPEWGCFDRIVNPATAAEFAALAGSEVLWVPGGHSWMLPRPQGQTNILTLLPRGQEFVKAASARRRLLLGTDAAAKRRPAKLAGAGRSTMRVVR